METKEFTVYATGLCYCSVCTTLTDVEQIKIRLPVAGTSRGWQLDEKGEFADGSPMPSPCEHNPDTHRHYLFSC